MVTNHPPFLLVIDVLFVRIANSFENKITFFRIRSYKERITVNSVVTDSAQHTVMVPINLSKVEIYCLYIITLVNVCVLKRNRIESCKIRSLCSAEKCMNI